MAKVFFSTGSNQGDRLSWLVKATQLIEENLGKVMVFSPVFESEPWGFESTTTFYNQVLMIETDLTPEQILVNIKSIENQLGRIRRSAVYSDRTIDIDLLFYNQVQVNRKNLIIPHPHLHLRRFVLEPLASIAAELTHPVFEVTVADLLAHTKDDSPVSEVLSQSEFKKLLHTFS